MTHHHGHHEKHPKPWHGNLHKRWQVWVIVLLMLAGMLAYIMTMDESWRPGRPPQAPVPAAP